MEVTVTLPAGRELKEDLSPDAAGELLGLISGVLGVPAEALVIHMNGIQIQLTAVFSGDTVSAYTVDFILSSDAAAASPVIRATGAPTVAAGVKSALVAASVSGAFKGPGKALADSLGVPLDAFANTPPTFLRVSPFNTQLLLKTLALSACRGRTRPSRTQSAGAASSLRRSSHPERRPPSSSQGRFPVV